MIKIKFHPACCRQKVFKPLSKTFFDHFLATSLIHSSNSSSRNLNHPDLSSVNLNRQFQSIRHFINLASLQNQQRITKMSQIPSSYGNFERVIEPFSLDSAPIQLVKWNSQKTGLSVVWANIDGPLVNGYFTVRTEIFNDSGVPHTLEHLIFLGSEKYPYKGILDSLANRAFARGTNAWTATTHTAYTVTTAGSDGFLRLLPVYLDHILYATITSEGFTTEVYHINGKGEDAGVVYSEMQGVENTSADLMALCNQRALYPPTSAYRSETGGLMKALRVLTVDQIREYHNRYYRPNNLQLIVTGALDPMALLKVLQEEVEPSIIKHAQDRIPSDWKRPFLETSSKGGAVLEKSQTITVDFPEKDESIGEVQISWIGPKTNDFLTQTAINILGTYLTESAVSPLSKRFIEIDSPFCTDITFSSTDAEKTVITAYLSSVPTEHLSIIGDLLKKALTQEADTINFDRLKNVIERTALKISNQMEVDAHDYLSSAVISNFLYEENEDLVLSLSNELQYYKTLANWPVEQWSTFFKKWLVEAPSLTVIGQPSAKLSDKLETDTNQRLLETQTKYGPEGLKKLEEKLQHAQQVNDRPVPDHIISEFPIPSLDSIKWIDVEIAQANGNYTSELQSFINQKDSASLPYFVQFNHIQSNFLSIQITLSPPDLPTELFPLLSTYLTSFFSLPIKRKDGTSLSYDEVVHQLDKETVEYEINLGSPISQTLEVYMKVEKSKYATAISWFRDLLWGSIFDLDRLRINTTKILQNIPARKRDGNDVSQELYKTMVYSAESAPLLSLSFLNQEVTLPLVLERLKSEPEAVIKQMEQLRSHLLKVSSMRISVSGNIRDLEEPKTTWLKNFQVLQPAPLQKPLMGHSVLGPEGIKPSGKAIVMSMTSIESSYACHFARGPQGLDHPDYAALSVAISVLNAMEGYLWKGIRGSGLAYGTSISLQLETGHVSLKIYRSPDSFKAFHESGKIIRDLVDGKLKFDDLILETAKSSLAYIVASRIATGADAAYEAFSNVGLKGVAPDSSKSLLEKIKAVTVVDAIKMIQVYILKIFDPKESSAAITSSINKSNEISNSLKLIGYSIDERKFDNLAESDEDGSEEMNSSI
ncbi:hypothetical protein O181_025498 [Austropuccinia psidii MF-1]|uniref:Mitochondrial presequence protease n=1 Tax=Austropuccinia psidii MF-1 TaxID=1389203 RepID=A0A9Q3GZ61_9BASI|nr:hypothetical protein [Austropuccinia psidii MF-1]